MLVGIVGFALAPQSSLFEASTGASLRYTAIIALIALPIFLRVFTAIVNSNPANVGEAIGTAIRSLIILDAAICYLASGCQIQYPFAVLLLLIPSFLLSRRISPT